MAEFDPSTANVDEVLKKLEKANEQERQRILNAERAGKKRVSILEEYGVDPDARVDASGRVLYPWEVAPEEQVVAVEVTETDEERKAREAQAEYAAKVDAARPARDEQGGGTPLGTEVSAPAAGGGAATGGTAGGGVAGGGTASAVAGASGNTSLGAPGT